MVHSLTGLSPSSTCRYSVSQMSILSEAARGARDRSRARRPAAASPDVPPCCARDHQARSRRSGHATARGNCAASAPRGCRRARPSASARETACHGRAANAALHWNRSGHRTARGAMRRDPVAAIRSRARPCAGGDHFGRALDAGDDGIRPSLLQKLADIARACAEIGDAADREIRHAHQQIDRGPQPVAGEFQILLRVPHHRAVFIFLSRCVLLRPASTRAGLPAQIIL